MFKWLGRLVDSNEKELKRIQPLVDKINDYEPAFQALDDDQLKATTEEFKHRLSEGETLDDILPEAFAAVREAARRVLGQRHYDVQLIAGIILHQGKITEMKTGEGKTLAATLPLYLNSLTGKGCHLVTVNDYLARWGAYWMGSVYNALGVSVASIYPMQSSDERSPSVIYDPEYDSGKENDPWPQLRPVSRNEAYRADITYGTSSEFGFDYLRDNMVTDLSQCVQQPLNYAIVDEVDNILIDEARTPLIISGPAMERGQIYKDINSIVARMKKKVLPFKPVSFEGKEELEKFEEEYDYIVFEKEHQALDTPRGQEKLARALNMTVEQLFGGETFDEENASMSIDEARQRNDILSVFRNAMSAHGLYQENRDYVVKDGEVIIVDTFTGRMMHGRRYSEGLHQAIEAKQGVKVKRESMTYATVTLQNYFRMYEKLAGMTGTAVTEAEEFHKIYSLEVVVLPTHVEYRASSGELHKHDERLDGVTVTRYSNPDTGESYWKRIDYSDRIYKSENGKFKAVVDEVTALHANGQPVLIGTVSIDKSEVLSEMLKRKGIRHQVLNAKQHDREARIIAEAGKLGAVTVATNMAGRGVDIALGGSPEGRPSDDWQNEHEKVKETGGLFIIGTEHHESRRIDNQLRGRAGRQGDPGRSRFYVSLDDDVVKRFGGDRIRGIMEWAGFEEDTPIENKIINRSFESSQVRVEGSHFDIRKHLVEYDDVVNQQREIIYGERRKILGGADLKTNILSMVEEEIRGIVLSHFEDEGGVPDDAERLAKELAVIMPLPPELAPDRLAGMQSREIEAAAIEHARTEYDRHEESMGPDDMRMLERLVMLRSLDSLWIEHLTAMETKRMEASWQSLRQVRSVDAYKNMGYEQFQILQETFKHDIARTIYHVGLQRKEPARQMSTPMVNAATTNPDNNGRKPKVKAAGKKVGRNDPCPCGSGKKYKHCHGK